MNHLPLTQSAFSGFELSVEERSFLWQQALTHSINGLVGLIAVRHDDNPQGQIINFRYLFANNTAIKDTLGSKNGITDLTGHLLTDFFPAIKETKLWEAYINVIETGEACRVEQNYRIDDREIWVIQSAAPFGHDGLMLSYTDSSDLHQTARRLARQTTLLNGVLNSSPNAIVVFEAVRNTQQEIINFQISLTNRQFEKLIDQWNMHFMGLMLTDIYPINPERIEQLKQRLSAEESIHMEEYVAVLEQWLSITLTPLNDGFVATIQNITASKQMHQQLKSTVQELHRSNKSLEQYAYVASHDLQEPLRKIVSFGDMIHSQHAHELNESASDLIRRMQTAADRMRSLVQDLLAFSRLSGNSKRFKPVDMNQLVSAVIDDLELTIQEQNARIITDQLPTVQGDASLLRQLVQNLLSNALKFQKPNSDHTASLPQIVISGRIVTNAELPPEIIASSTTTTDRQFVVLTIGDNGIGFDERYLDRIFTIFQRLHGRLVYKGTGMGLAICKKVVDIHGGYITAKSQEGQGSTFQVYLPSV